MIFKGLDSSLQPIRNWRASPLGPRWLEAFRARAKAKRQAPEPSATSTETVENPKSAPPPRAAKSNPHTA